MIWNEWSVPVTGGNMELLTARMDFAFDPLPDGFKEQVEALVAAEIAADRPIEVSFLPRGMLAQHLPDGPPPADPVSAEAVIVAAFAAFSERDGDDLPFVEHGHELLSNMAHRAVLEHGQWKLCRSSLAQLLSLAGVVLPPPEP